MPPHYLKSEIAVEFFVKEVTAHDCDDGAAAAGAARSVSRGEIKRRLKTFIDERSEAFACYVDERFRQMVRSAEGMSVSAILAQQIEPGRGIDGLKQRWSSWNKWRAHGGQRVPKCPAVEFPTSDTLLYAPGPPPPPPPPPPQQTRHATAGPNDPNGRTCIMWDLQRTVNAHLRNGLETVLIGITDDVEPVEMRLDDGVLLRPDLFEKLCTKRVDYKSFEMCALGPDYNDKGTDPAKSYTKVLPKGPLCLAGTCLCCTTPAKSSIEMNRELWADMRKLWLEDQELFDPLEFMEDEAPPPSAEQLDALERFQRERAAALAPLPPRLADGGNLIDALTRDLQAARLCD